MLRITHSAAYDSSVLYAWSRNKNNLSTEAAVKTLSRPQGQFRVLEITGEIGSIKYGSNSSNIIRITKETSKSNMLCE